MTSIPVIMSAWRGRVTAVPQRPQPKLEASTSISRFYVVRPGDTLGGIAERYEVGIDRLAAANGLRMTSILSLGRKLKIPATGGPEVAAADPVRAGSWAADSSVRGAGRDVTQRARLRESDANALKHTVQTGDTTWVIARRYRIKVDDLIEANDLGEDGRIQPGQRLTIPGRQAAEQRGVLVPRGNRDEPRLPAVRPEPRSPRRTAFIWPSRGVLTSRFGMRYRRHHNGIDIASPTGTPIYAARDGVVTFAARRGGYGLVVYVDHGDGYVTVYGHASSIHVKLGERVKRGALIARVGCTGSCTGAHVHFEVHENGTPVNPLKLLR